MNAVKDSHTRIVSPASPEPHSEPWRLRRSELLLIFAFWTVIAILTSATRVLDPRGPGLQFGLPSGPMAVAFFEAYLWAALTPVIFWLSSRFGIDRSNWIQPILLFAAVGVVVAVFVDVADDMARIHILDNPRRGAGVSPIRVVTRLWFLNELIVYVAILAAGFAREYFVRYRARQEEAVRLQARTAQLQAQLADARLEALRMQINPHFLFNTLHAISTLVERDPRGVRRMIARLSELLRYTLDGAGDQEVPLDQELQFLEQYLEIMQIRFQGRLEVETRIDPDVRKARVPNLILLPLVENAIKHGVNQTEGTGRIVVGALRRGDRLVLSVRDSGPGFSADATNGAEAGGVGLRNTRARLEQLYGADQLFAMRSADEGGTIAEIELPYHEWSELSSDSAVDTVVNQTHVV